jgi:DnaJ-domain-containing protein 1
MGLLSWARRQFGNGTAAVAPPGQPSLSLLALERARWAETLKEYNSGHRRLSPLTESLTGETAEIRNAYRQLLKEPVAKAALLG